VGKRGPQPPVSHPASHGHQPVSRAKNLPGLGRARAMTPNEAGAENKTSDTIIQKIFDELPVP